MGTFAAVMTGQGTGAISTIEVFGEGAGAIIEKIFRPAGGETLTFEAGRILVGAVVDGGETIDQVVVGCEGANAIAINCHGNPLIVELIMELLHKQGAELITAEQLLAKELVAQGSLNTIAVEARLAQVRSLTLKGTRIILNQIGGGLNEKAAQWIEQADDVSIEQIRAEAAQILRDSQTAKLIISGCTAVITGPPNSGKSTLLNYLCGKQKAIVTDVKGTTRDWVSGRCQIGPLSVELIDTAGLERELAESTDDAVERAAQQKTLEFFEKADLVLLVLDGGEHVNQFDETVLEKIADKKILTVINKCDLPHRLDIDRLPQILKDGLQISAKFGTGIENLVKKIPQICGAAGFDSRSPICVSERQENLLKSLEKVPSTQEAVTIIAELLNGRLEV
ncbi:MAG TPA: GTPase [Sedimentisphaerales bacterium]|nr:GTPase [Sedimentisphaerales bacterium]